MSSTSCSEASSTTDEFSSLIFPKDAKDKDGAPFWSGPKRAPTPITFDVSKKEHIDFIVSYANLIAATLKIDENRDAG